MGLVLVLSIIWLPGYLVWIKVRKAMSSTRRSVTGCLWFGLVRGVMFAPGLLSGGHPPPIPVPIPFGALLFFPFAILLWQRANGDGLIFVLCNLASLLIASAVSIAIELIRYNRQRPES